MKKLAYMVVALLVSTLMASCSKDEIGGTATQNTAGKWYVTVDAVDDAGNVVYEDIFRLGRVNMLTYNTAANTPSEMIVDDLGNIWEFKVKVACDQQNLTFEANTTENNNMVEGYEDINVPITDGKILPKANFSDDLQADGTPTPEAYGFAKYRVSGVRYSGLEEND